MKMILVGIVQRNSPADPEKNRAARTWTTFQLVSLQKMNGICLGTEVAQHGASDMYNAVETGRRLLSENQGNPVLVDVATTKVQFGKDKVDMQVSGFELVSKLPNWPGVAATPTK